MILRKNKIKKKILRSKKLLAVEYKPFLEKKQKLIDRRIYRRTLFL